MAKWASSEAAGDYIAMVSGGRIVPVAVIAAVVLSGCGAPKELPLPSSSPTPSASASPTSTSTPTQTGVSLRQLGFANGPLDEFTLPSNLQISTRVDQPNVVTIVLASPRPEETEDYLRTTLPGEGFTIDARAAAGQAMTFSGHGWVGGFTGTGDTSAVTLRPRSAPTS